MNHSNISIFIPHNGCPHQCSFCNQREITGQQYQPGSNDVINTVETAIKDLGDKCAESEIAFFGGSFTAIDRDYMISLLDSTKPYIDKFEGIRISTRPDCIDCDVLSLLKQYKVTTIELGAQSMDNIVLSANRRGHTAEDVKKSALLIKKYGFRLGLQMMTGLYMADFESDYNTALEFIKLKPDCVRVYPTVVMRNTELGDLFSYCKYTPYTLKQSVDICSKIIELFYVNNIDVIRVGLHYSESLVHNDLAGNYHPAFKELCESKIFFERIKKQIKDLNSKKIELTVNPKSRSKLIGQKRINIERLEAMGYEILVKTNDKLDKYEVLVKEHR